MHFVASKEKNNIVNTFLDSKQYIKIFSAIMIILR